MNRPDRYGALGPRLALMVEVRRGPLETSLVIEAFRQLLKKSSGYRRTSTQQSTCIDILRNI